MKNHYDILGIDRKATPDQIKTAYRKLSIKFHPDKNDSELFFSDMFRQINEAYNILIDNKKRSIYDKDLYSFENPIKQTENTSKTYTAGSSFKVKTQPNYNYQSYTPKPSVWDGVKSWRKFRTILLLLNLLLVIILFVRANTTNQIQPSNENRISSIAPKKHRRHRKKKNQIIDTTNTSPQIDPNTSLASNGTLKDSTKTDSVPVSNP